MASIEYTVRFAFGPDEAFDVTTLSTAGGTLADEDNGEILGLDEAVFAEGVTGRFKGFLEFFFEGAPYRLLRVENEAATWFFGTIPNAVTDYFIDRYPNLGVLNDDWENVTQFAEDVIVCFAPGTRIATPDGERVVESIGIGDHVMTADGRAVAVRWMGRKTVRKVMAGERARPVRVREGALAPGVPHGDLVVTADHALIVDGLAVNAGALVNGGSIAFVPLEAVPAVVTYWHIETEAHDEILANGAPVETFVDNVRRMAFDNHRDYLHLYGHERIIPEMRRPRVSARRQLPPALAARLGIGSFADDVEADFASMMARIDAA